jgi:hypothetical protein
MIDKDRISLIDVRSSIFGTISSLNDHNTNRLFRGLYQLKTCGVH